MRKNIVKRNIDIMRKVSKNIGEQKAITLIALIVTIVVLLILASVSIAMLTGENGIINKASSAKEKNTEAQEQENITLADYENKISKYVDGNRNETINSSKRTLLYDGTTDEKGNITKFGQNDGSSERTLYDDVNNYDEVLVYIIDQNENVYSPTIIDKSYYNVNFRYYLSNSSTLTNNIGELKIDSTNNKIMYVNNFGTYTYGIQRVIGLKF